jgi:hypothetical protein
MTIKVGIHRTIWMNRKAHRSGIRDNPKCDRCEEEESMEYLLYGCENYSAVVWSELSTLLTNTLAHIVGHNIGRMDLTFNHIVFNIPHQSLVIYLEDQLSITTILHLIQEQKRDIVCRRMTLTTPRGPISHATHPRPYSVCADKDHFSLGVSRRKITIGPGNY